MTRQLPKKANLEHLRKQAKQLLKDHKAGDLQVCNRIRDYHPRFSKLSEQEIHEAKFSLQDAQFTIANEYGFASWPKLTAAIKSTSKQQLLFGASNRGDIEEVRKLINSYHFEKSELNLPLSRATCNMSGERADDYRACSDYLIDRGADVNGECGNDYGPIILASCEFLNPEGLQYLIDRGALVQTAERVTRYPATNTPMKMVLGTYDRRPDRKHRCLDILIEAGANYEDGPIIDIHRGRYQDLQERMIANPELLRAHVDLEYGNHLTLHGVSLLHIAAEFNEKECVDVLLDQGADINNKAKLGKNGTGGQTALYHVIGGNRGRCYPLFKHLLTKGPALDVSACIQSDVIIHPDKDHTYDEVLELTPLGYALRYEHAPGWHEASREVAELRKLDAPI